MPLSLLILVACLGERTTIVLPDTGAQAPRPDTGAPEPVDSGTESGSVDSATDSAVETADPLDSGETGETGENGAPIDTTPPPWCPSIAEPDALGVVVHEDLDELSGVVESRLQPGVLWTHNDSGDTDRFFALSRAGELLATFTIEGVHPRDLEDLAIGPGPDGEENYLYLGDVGDNARSRDTVRVLRLPEPTVDVLGEDPMQGTVEPEVIELEFFDGVARDSESIFVDPLSGDLYSVIKDRDGLGISGVFRAEAPFGPEGVAPLIQVAELIFGSELLPGSDLTTGADISSDGQWIVIRSYSDLFLWWRDPAAPLWDAFDHNPCPSPVASEPQGEAVGFAANGRDYLTISERTEQPVNLYVWQE